MDFNRITQTLDDFDPERRVVRSTQTREEQSSSNEGRDGQVTVGNELPGANQGGANGNNSREASRKTEETVNYEIARTQRTEVIEAGRVKRVSVAVLVDGIYARDAQGNVNYQPRSAEELDRIGALVRSAIGFDQRRGDQIEIVNLRFAEAPQLAAPEAPKPWWMVYDFTKDDIRYAIEMVVLLLVSLLVLLFVVRPLMRRIMAPEEERAAAITSAGQASVGGVAGGSSGATGGQEGEEGATAGRIAAPPLVPGIENATMKMIEMAQIKGEVHQASLAKVSELVDKNPHETVAIIRQWLNDGNRSSDHVPDGSRRRIHPGSRRSCRRRACQHPRRQGPDWPAARGDPHAHPRRQGLGAHLEDARRRRDPRAFDRHVAAGHGGAGYGREPDVGIRRAPLGGRWPDGQFRRDGAPARPVHAARAGRHADGGDPGPAGRNMWEKLSNVQEQVLANYLKNEYPQTVAVVLSKIKPEHAGRVLAILPEEFALDVVGRMLKMEAIQKDVLERIEQTLRTEFMSNLSQTSRRDSHEAMAEIFNSFDRQTETRFLTALEEQNRDSAERIKNLMFTFDDLAKLDAGSAQTLVRQVDKDKLAVALKGASQTMRDFFLAQMSTRAAKMMQDDMQALGPMRLKDVDEAQGILVNLAKDLAAKGEIMITKNRADDELVF